MSVTRQTVADGLRFSRMMTETICKGFPEDKAAHQPSPSDNPFIWQLGHLATTDQWLSCLLDGKPKSLPESYDGMFGYNSTPKGSLKDYPPLAEVRSKYHSERQRLHAALEGASDAVLASQPEAIKGFADNLLQATDRLAWHDGWHTGQISSLRRAVGLGSAF